MRMIVMGVEPRHRGNVQADLLGRFGKATEVFAKSVKKRTCLVQVKVIHRPDEVLNKARVTELVDAILMRNSYMLCRVRYDEEKAGTAEDTTGLAWNWD